MSLEFKKIREEWKQRKKEEAANRKHQGERQHQAATAAAAQNGGCESWEPCVPSYAGLNVPLCPRRYQLGPQQHFIAQKSTYDPHQHSQSCEQPSQFPSSPYDIQRLGVASWFNHSGLADGCSSWDGRGGWSNQIWYLPIDSCFISIPIISRPATGHSMYSAVYSSSYVAILLLVSGIFELIHIHSSTRQWAREPQHFIVDLGMMWKVPIPELMQFK